jgi:predicted kinase
MHPLRLLLITGLPGTGKTTLARQLARHYSMALIAKDTIKESLLDCLASPGGGSCALSDAAFAVMLSVAAELLASGVDVILEGNFRWPAHSEKVLSALPQTPHRLLGIAQVLCRLDEPERLARLTARQSDPTRHPGHELAAQRARVPACNDFLELPGERLLFDARRGEAALSQLVASLDAAWSGARER